jgi:hypothetical protein
LGQKAEENGWNGGIAMAKEKKVEPHQSSSPEIGQLSSPDVTRVKRNTSASYVRTRHASKKKGGRGRV